MTNNASGLMMTQLWAPLAATLVVPKRPGLLEFGRFDILRTSQPTLSLGGMIDLEKTGSRKSPLNLLLLQGLGRGRFPQLPRLRPH
jgi:hypothetical protein